ncbi:MAG: hypothetical protein ABIC04_07885 [Nanoarchaeota archaeon]
MKKIFNVGVLITLFLMCSYSICIAGDCFADSLKSDTTVSATGVKKLTVKVKTNAEGYTVEQENIAGKMDQENKPGAIKHLYVISCYSGQVIEYHTIKGKVTSSGKRLTPYTVVASGNQYANEEGFPVNINGRRYYTSEVLQDDGTYGHSIPYLYFWDAKGIFQKVYVSGGMYVRISGAPIGGVKGVILNIDTGKKNITRR